MTKGLTEWRLSKPRKTKIDVNITLGFEVESKGCGVMQFQVRKLSCPSIYYAQYYEDV
jgi:hypothetical protein